ncbi:MAG: extracellular solute-binding protein [Treponema sp.]|nr:extracellular solute-binding protein [Treponema sp.]
MKVNRNRWFLLIAAAATFTLLVSCSGKSGAGNVSASKLLDPKTPVTIKYWYPLNAGNNTEADLHGPGLDKLYEATGVTIDFIAIPAAGTEEQYNLLMASGDIPDVVAYNVRGLKQYNKAFIPVDTYIKGNPGRYPMLNKYCFDDYLNAYLGDEDGHLRIVPMLATRRIGDILMLRTDLLQKYNGGIMPVTADDWYNLLTAAKNDGKIGFMSRYQRAGLLYRLLAGYMDCVIEDYFVEDGVVKYGVTDPRLRAGVELARKWYAEGLIDREYPSTNSTIWSEAVLRGDVFATHDNIQRVQWAVNDYMYVQNPPVPYRMAGVGPMQSPITGKRNTVIHYPRVRDKSASISVNAKAPERILDFFEYCFTDDGFILMNFGIEGLSFSYVNGIPFPDPTYSTRKDRGEVPPIGSTMDMVKNQADELFFNYNDPAREDHRLTREARDLYMNNDFIRENWIASLSFTDAERQILSPINAELNTYRGEMLDKFIMGVETMDHWDAFVSQIKRMNLDQAVKIYQDALDRMIKK